MFRAGAQIFSGPVPWAVNRHVYELIEFLVVMSTGHGDINIGGVCRTRGRTRKRKEEKVLMVEERQKITSHEDSEDEIYTAQKTRSTQKVPLLNESPSPKLNTHNTTVKHVLVIRDEDDSGISESASEESNIITELPSGETIPEKKESLLSIVIQIFFPYLIAGFGMMLAGFLLDYVQVRCMCIL